MTKLKTMQQAQTIEPMPVIDLTPRIREVEGYHPLFRPLRLLAMKDEFIAERLAVSVATAWKWRCGKNFPLYQQMVTAYVLQFSIQFYEAEAEDIEAKHGAEMCRALRAVLDYGAVCLRQWWTETLRNHTRAELASAASKASHRLLFEMAPGGRAANKGRPMPKTPPIALGKGALNFNFNLN